MTQDDQKFTEEDLKKAEGIVETIFTDCVTELGLTTLANEVIAQSMRDERKGLEDKVLELEAEIKSLIERHGFQLEARENMIAFNNERLKALEAENEQLKAEFIHINRVACNAVNERDLLKIRLSEAVRVLELASKTDPEYWAKEKDNHNLLRCAMNMKNHAIDFLQSPTNSEAQDRQRLRDAVIAQARKEHPVWMDKCQMCDDLKALDSLCDKKTGGV